MSEVQSTSPGPSSDPAHSPLQDLPGGLSVVPSSIVHTEAAEWALARGADGPRLLALATRMSLDAVAASLEGDRHECAGCPLIVCPTSARNAEALRRALPWLRPEVLGLATSVGFGDRLGLATPGHVSALRSAGGSIRPVFAQQSIREMTRTGRTPTVVIDDAMWGVFEAGWRGGSGADADHLKRPEDVAPCAAAGFTLFTVDPGDHVDGTADAASASDLREAADRLPWADLATDWPSLFARLRGFTMDLEGATIVLDEERVLRAAVKYGRAIAHVARMYRCIEAAVGARPFELEVSVDETDTPTSPADHIVVAVELRRLGVRWVGLAPRFVGRFEKGVDYIGDVRLFEDDVRVHAAIARLLGPYKLSLHSGSDKFSIYGVAARQTGGLVHLKTAGTSYLEALRALSEVAPSLFRAIYAFSRACYDRDRASYHVSASVARTPAPEDVADHALGALLDDFDAREVLHVTFGSVLTCRRDDGSRVFGDAMERTLCDRHDVYARCLERHFVRHLVPFTAR